MAAGTEIERLLVRLVGDNSSYVKALKQASKITKDELNKTQAMLGQISKTVSLKTSSAAVQAANQTKGVLGAFKAHIQKVRAELNGYTRDSLVRLHAANGKFVTQQALVNTILGNTVGKVANASLALGGRLASSLKRVALAAASAASQLSMFLIPLVGGLLGKAVLDASNASENLAKFGAVFGREAASAGAFADELAEKIGRSANEIRSNMAAFQSFFVGLGFGATESRQFTQQLQQMTLDFAAFHNLSDEEAMGRFISALSGSSEVMDQFGVNIKQAALEEELLRMGIKKSITQATEQEKAIARLNVIMKVMTGQGAMGAASRESESFANRLKALKAELTKLSVEVGERLMPHALALVNTIREWAESAQEANGAMDTMIWIGSKVGEVWNNLQARIAELAQVTVWSIKMMAKAWDYLPFIDMSDEIQALESYEEEFRRVAIENRKAAEDLSNTDIAKEMRDRVAGGRQDIANRAAGAAPMSMPGMDMSDIRPEAIGEFTKAMEKQLRELETKHAAVKAGLTEDQVQAQIEYANLVAELETEGKKLTEEEQKRLNLLYQQVSARQEAVKAQEEEKKKAEEATKEAKQKLEQSQKDMASRASSFLEGTLTPLQELKKNLIEVHELQKKGALTAEEAQAIQNKMVADHAASQQVDKVTAGAAVRFGSAESEANRLQRPKEDTAKGVWKLVDQTKLSLRTEEGILAELQKQNTDNQTVSIPR